MSKPQKKWKMAILIWIAIYPTVTLIAILFGNHFEKIFCNMPDPEKLKLINNGGLA